MLVLVDITCAYRCSYVTVDWSSCDEDEGESGEDKKRCVVCVVCVWMLSAYAAAWCIVCECSSLWNAGVGIIHILGRQTIVFG